MSGVVLSEKPANANEQHPHTKVQKVREKRVQVFLEQMNVSALRYLNEGLFQNGKL
jgi:actin-related protein